MFSCNLPPALLAEWPGFFTCYCGNTGGGTDTEIRVSTESRPWRRKFSRRSSRDSNPRPFNHESGALTTELSPPPFIIGHSLSLICQPTSKDIKHHFIIRGGRWSWTFKLAQKRSWVGRWSWAEQVGRPLLRVVQVVHEQRCNGHCLSDSVQHSSWNSNCAVHKSLGNDEGTLP